MHSTTTEFHIDIVCIVLVVAGAVAFAFLSLLVLFYDIFFLLHPRMNQDRMAVHKEFAVVVCVCLRMIIYVCTIFGALY